MVFIFHYFAGICFEHIIAAAEGKRKKNQQACEGL
jgi:hypothetical protein